MKADDLMTGWRPDSYRAASMPSMSNSAVLFVGVPAALDFFATGGLNPLEIGRRYAFIAVFRLKANS
jgi:hypothetical protein